MSFILRPSTARATFCATQIIKRSAHKKVNLQVRLNEYVEGLGKKGEVVSVRPGLMRNILFPTKKASYISKDYQPEPEQELNDMDEILKQTNERLMEKEAVALKKDQELLTNLKNVYEIKFSRAVIPGSENTFGSVTAEDIINKLKEEYNVTVERATIQVKSESGRIKSLGSHPVSVQIGHQTVELTVQVDPTA
ncbi:hypothetical protein G6F46_004474 [Rhizopus delemar]|nr:hypothetical protein G6F43_006513 [Rhizopus delemar]KAG1546596.1 hypothetical protein G6F51_004789 [Rhizopus arrhizus]KAG1458423.1 hypothetical protein G6F55_005359 [Rhizopus delemar]KAG1497367.1 hypothetical protein G6F54_005817 [Rhizopus delemar]KAG1513991.1 hypothetical protein G6F53_004018 [Rhizopus delemar]